MENINSEDCWGVKKCPETAKIQCPAFINKEGKRCWLVTGTMCCGGVKQDNLFLKMKACHACEFYKLRNGVPA